MHQGLPSRLFSEEMPFSREVRMVDSQALPNFCDWPRYVYGAVQFGRGFGGRVWRAYVLSGIIEN